MSTTLSGTSSILADASSPAGVQEAMQDKAATAAIAAALRTAGWRGDMRRAVESRSEGGEGGSTGTGQAYGIGLGQCKLPARAGEETSALVRGDGTLVTGWLPQRRGMCHAVQFIVLSYVKFNVTIQLLCTFGMLRSSTHSHRWRSPQCCPSRSTFRRFRHD